MVPSLLILKDRVDEVDRYNYIWRRASGHPTSERVSKCCTLPNVWYLKHRRYVVVEGWVSTRDFLLGLAIIQAFPGPNFNCTVLKPLECD